ncbi:hypothetical protein [Sphingomonas sp.]|uniref:hypothetical protein n=1 Tax=Sphingomonas sp. TaxID=28214 RepID=UPI002EDAFF2B
MTLIRTLILAFTGLFTPSATSIVNGLARTADKLDGVQNKLSTTLDNLSNETTLSFKRQSAAVGRETAFRENVRLREDRVAAEMGHALRVRDRIRALID